MRISSHPSTVIVIYRLFQWPPATQSYVCQCCYVPAGGYKHIDVLVTGEPGSCQLQKSWLGANGGVLFLWERLSERSEDRPEAGSYQKAR